MGSGKSPILRFATPVSFQANVKTTGDSVFCTYVTPPLTPRICGFPQSVSETAVRRPAISNPNTRSAGYRREDVFCALALAFFVLTGLCLFWLSRSTRESVRSINAVQVAAEWHDRGSQLNRHLGQVLTIAMEPVGVENRNGRFTAARKRVDTDLDVLRSEAESFPQGEERRMFLREIDAIGRLVYRAVEAAQLSIEESAREGVEPEDHDSERTRSQMVREIFAEASIAIDRMRTDALRAERQQTVMEHQSLSWHGNVELVLGILVLGLVCAVAVALYRSAAKGAVKAEELRSLARKLGEAKAKYRSIFDNAVEGIFQASPDGRIHTANRALAHMYGYSSPEDLIEHLGDAGSHRYVDPARRAELVEALQAEDIVSNFESEVIRADRRTIWIRENVHAVRGSNGEIEHLEGTVEDISERWWGEQRRRLQYATARVIEKSANVAEARPMILQTICEILDWDMAAIWDVDPEASILSSVEIWHAPEIDLTEFRETAESTAFVPGDGLAGEVWESGEPKWVADLRRTEPSPSGHLALANGMESAFGVAVKVHGEVQHVVEFFSSKISLPDPELLQTLGVIANQLGHLIERKGGEEALRKSEARKAAILHAALDCIISFEMHGRIVEFNPAAERAFGLTQTEALGRDIAELIVPESLQHNRRLGLPFYNPVEAERLLGKRMELVALRSDGKEFPVEVAVSRVRIDGKPMFTAYMRDITDRKEAERVLSELAAVVANSNDAIIGASLDGEIRSWNAGAERIYGYSTSEAIGRPLHMLLPRERLDEFPRMLALVQKGDSLVSYETVRLCKDGRKIDVSLTDSPIREGGKITGVSSIARDITERKRLEEELLQSQKMDAVGRLAGGIAHDFNNILTAILGYSDLIISQIDDRQWMYKHLCEIRKAADFAASLTHQLLAFSRRQPLFLRVFSVNDSVRNMQKMLQRVIGEHIKIQTSFDAETGRLKADPSQLEQVLLNLCVNARDAMPAGGTISIATTDVTYFPSDGAMPISEMPAGEYVKLTVSDTGTGISPEVLKHIFEPFFTTKQNGQGTGLGLATCYGIVKQSGGYIAVDSTVGQGTIFAIYLPRVDESGEKAHVRKEIGELPGGHETILYVEDEISVRSLTAHVLRRLGYTVLEAADGKQARTIVETQNGRGIDLLFADVVLPDLGGRELADWVSTRNTRTRLLFTSGYVDEGILRRHGLTPGMPFLQKPFTPADLAKKVREVFGDRG